MNTFPDQSLKPLSIAGSPVERTSLPWLPVVLGFGLLALLVMAWRWGGVVEDSLAYYDTARFFRGEIAVEALRAPFPYRTLVPALAALIPGELTHTFAGLNWLFTTVTACLLAYAAARMGLDRKRIIGAGLLVILSVPTFWYAPYLLVDPGSICARALFVVGILTGQSWIALVAGLMGTAIREENILLLVWLVAFRRVPFMIGLAAIAAAGAWLLAVRWWLITGLPSYTWLPSLAAFWYSMSDPRTLASLLAGLGIVVPLAVWGWRRAPQELQPLKSLLLLMALPPMYAALCVRVDGRAIWGLYPMLIPFAVCAGRDAWKNR